MILVDSAALAGDHATGNRFGWQVRAEALKLTTTALCRWLPLGLLLGTGQALLRNAVTHHYQLHPPLSRLGAADRARALADAAHAHTYAGHVQILGDMLTSGQFAGGLLTLLLAVLVVTGENTHRTAVPTFLINPRRGRVLAAKLTVVAGVAAGLWLLSTLVNVIVTSIWIRSEGFNVAGSDPVPLHAVGLNLLAYLMWAAFGIGLAALLRTQTVAVAVSVAVYLMGSAAGALLADLVHQLYPHAWTLGLPVLAPAVATVVMTTPGRAFEHAPPQWVGLLVMAGYTIAMTLAGLASSRRRDVT
jgi:ABC-2 type transport system permease protein